MVKNTDLHTHSYYSDGQISPKDLVRLAKKRGIKNLALTDHDSIKGLEEAIAEGKKIGVKVIPSVEVNVDGGEVLGYFIDIKNKELAMALKYNRKMVEGRTREYCKKLKKEGYDISFKELQKRFPKSKNNLNMFFPLYLLYLKGYGNPFELANKLKDNKKLKVKKEKHITFIKAIKLIKKAGGVPVLAHPWVDDTKKMFNNLENFIKAGLKGIELDNGDRPPFKPKGMDGKIRSIAKKYGLILTSGSDYHGEEIRKVMLGNHDLGKNNCDEKVVEKLRKLAKD